MTKKIAVFLLSVLSFYAPMQGMHFARGFVRNASRLAAVASAGVNCAVAGYAVSEVRKEMRFAQDSKDKQIVPDKLERWLCEPSSSTKQLVGDVLTEIGASETEQKKITLLSKYGGFASMSSPYSHAQNSALIHIPRWVDAFVKTGKTDPGLWDYLRACFRGPSCKTSNLYIDGIDGNEIGPFSHQEVRGMIKSTLAHEYGHLVHHDNKRRRLCEKFAWTGSYFATAFYTMFMPPLLRLPVRAISALGIVATAESIGKRARILFDRFDEYQADRYAIDHCNAQELEAYACWLDKHHKQFMHKMIEDKKLQPSEVEMFENNAWFREWKWIQIDKSHPSSKTRANYLRKAAQEKRKAELKANETNEIL